MLKNFKLWFDDFREELRYHGCRSFIPKRVRDWYYETKCYFFPYNVIRVKTIKRTWTDRSEVLLHAPFQILVDFVEKEWMPDQGQLIDVDQYVKELKGHTPEGVQQEIKSIQKHNEVNREIWTIYNWWTKVRPARKDPTDDIRCPEHIVGNNGETNRFFLVDGDDEVWDNAMKLLHKLEDEWKKEDEEMLLRLFKVRDYLWT